MNYSLKSLKILSPIISIIAFVLAIIAAIQISSLFHPRHTPDQLAFCPAKSTWRHASYVAYRNLTHTKSIEKVLESDFCGVEIDIIWDSRGFFYVAHDPYPEAAPIADDIKLEHLMKELGGKKIHWWLDWKNPEFTNIIPASKALDTMAKTHLPSSSYFFVESARLFSMSAFSMISSDRIRPVFWITKHEWSKLPGALANLRSIGTLLFQPRYISMSDPQILISWKYIVLKSNLFLFTLNNQTTIKNMFNKGYSVILTDLNKPVAP
jgi:hypothetical protein